MSRKVWNRVTQPLGSGGKRKARRTWKVLTFELLSTTLTTVGVFGYIIGKFIYPSNIWWIAVCAILFSFLLKSVVELYIFILITFFSRATILPEVDFAKGISPEHESALVYCVKAESMDAVRIAIDSLENSLRGNHVKNLHGIYLSGTMERNLVLREIREIRRLQRLFGGSQVLYFHRQSNWGKKWGAYQDLMVWLSTGSVYPVAYLSNTYARYKRDPGQRFFSLELIDKSVIGDLLNKKEIETGIVGDISMLQVNNGGSIKYLLISDADVLWPPGTAVKTVCKMAHPDNEAFAIFQPRLEVRNSQATLYSNMHAWGRRLYEFANLATWKIYDSYNFYGKGGIKIDKYRETMLIPGEEVLPPIALSHDFIEARHLWTAYLPDVQLLEDVSTNYLDDLEKLLRWTIGDLIGIYYEALLPTIGKLRAVFRTSPTQHKEMADIGITANLIMRLVCRFNFSPLVFALFLFFTLLGGSLPGIYLTENPLAEIALMWFVLVGVAVLPKILGPVAAYLHMGASASKPLATALLIAPIELLLSTLLFLQQIIDRNVLLLKSTKTLLSSRFTSHELEWHTSTTSDGQLSSLSYWAIYKQRIGVVAFGIALPLLCYFTQPRSSIWYTSPIWLSFLLGPWLTKLTSLPVSRARR